MKIGLAGVGYLGSRHLNHLVNLGGVEVSGIWDIDRRILDAAALKFGVPAASGLDDLIARSDAVDVVTPTSNHFETGCRVIEAGKPVFIEKPLCATVEEAQRLIHLAEGGGVQVQVGHIERFNRAFRALGKAAPEPRFIEAHRLAPWNPRGMDVAVVFDLMIHDLDLALALTNEKPHRIHANGVGVVSDTIDIATARIEFTGGMVANLTASRISLKRMRKLRLFSERAYVALDLDRETCEFVGVVDDPSQVPKAAQSLGGMTLSDRSRTLYRRFLEAPPGDALRLELEAFRDSVVRGTEPPVTGGDALRSLELAERIVATVQGG